MVLLLLLSTSGGGGAAVSSVSVAGVAVAGVAVAAAAAAAAGAGDQKWPFHHLGISPPFVVLFNLAVVVALLIDLLVSSSGTNTKG